MTGGPAPLIESRLRKAIGRRTTANLGQVAAKDFQRFAYAAGHLNAPISDAREHQPTHAPLLFVPAVMGWNPGPPEAQLRADGTETTSTANLPLDGLRLMGAGQDLQFHARVTDGMNLTVETHLAGVERKKGRSGQLLTLTIIRDYFDHRRQLILTCTETVIAR